MLETGVLALSILADHDDIYILVARGEPWQIKAVDERGIEIELLPQYHIQRADASAHRSPQSSFQTHLILHNGFKHLRRQALHIAMHIVLLEIHGCMHRIHDLFDRAGYERSDAVSRDQSDGARGSVAGARHVGDGSLRRGGSGGEQIPDDDRESSPRHLDRSK